LSEESKDIFILGGPNGAGKTTAARVLLPAFLNEHEFLNADEIAREISPHDPESAAIAAARELILRMRGLIQRNKSFAIETTCSGRSYIPIFKACKEQGWRFNFLYLWIPSPEISIARVAQRVMEGGHGIASDVIHRRFRTSIWNMLHLYLPLADTAAIYDNSHQQRILIAERESGLPLRILDPDRWSRLEELAR